MIKTMQSNRIYVKFLTGFVLFFAVMGFVAVGLSEVVDKIVVVVNDQTITSSEIDAVIKPLIEELKKNSSPEELPQKIAGLRKDVIERLIEDRLILQEAKKLNIEAGNNEIEERLQQVKAKFPDQESFEKILAEQGMNLWQLKKTYKDQIMVRKMIRQYVKSHLQITPTQVSEYYKQHLNDFKMDEARDVSQIIIKYKPGEDLPRAEKIAAQIVDLLAAGADFGDVCKKYSEGPNADTGGSIGFVERGIMAKDIDEVIFKMKEGEVSKPVKTGIGFVILKLNSIRNEQFEPIEKAKDKIEDLLMDQNAKTTIDSWLSELKEKAFISIKE